MADDNSQLINTLMGMLGDNPQEKINAVLSSLSSGSENSEAAQSQDDGSSAQIPDLSSLMKMQSLLSGLGGSDDERTRLLMALKPFLSEQRKPHIDRAMQLLKLTKLAGAAKELDLLKDLKL